MASPAADDPVNGQAWIDELTRELPADPFRAMWEMAADAIALSDPEGTVLLANPAYFALYGYSADEVIGQNFAVIFPEEAREAARAGYRETFDAPVPPEAFEAVVRRKDGAERIVEARIGFLTGPTGERAAMVNVIRDITRRQRAEESALLAELQLEQTLEAEKRARSEAESALRQRDEFLATVSHDLQNPLAAIRGSAELLGRRVARGDPGDGPVVVELASSIVATADQMSAQVDDLVDLAREAAGHAMVLEREPVDAALLAREVLTTYGEVLARQRVRFESGAASVIGQWDRVRVRRVLANLVVNAAKYSPPGARIDIEIGREVAADGPCATIMVRDQGIGIPEEDLPRIFERFYRGANAPASVRGSGLGLASARQIVEAHGGSLSVKSKFGAGSTFTVRLPL